MEKIIHLLIPRQSNNHRAKVIHSSSLIVISFLFLLFQFSLNTFSKIKPQVLGYASQISIDSVINLTNQKRAENGLAPLKVNKTLSDAAYTKGRDMIDRDYWAHVAPDGTEPWTFFKRFGYKYKYAGENLARDFSNANDAVNAWMNSPTHRENILNPKYKEIGIGVVEGDLAGSDTTIIVQFFGTSYADNVSQPLATAGSTQSETVDSSRSAVLAVNNDSDQTSKVLVSPYTTTKMVSTSLIGFLVLIFVVDALVIQRKKIRRVAGRSFAHIAFFGMIFVLLLLLKSGKII